MNSPRHERCTTETDPKEIRAFARDLARHGLYVLPCGGGAHPEPRRALRGLLPRYGRDATALLSLAALTDFHEVVPCAETRLVAAGVLYHLADDWLLGHVLNARRRLLGSECQPQAREYPDRLGLLEDVIAGVCKRLGKALPRGIDELDEIDEFALFWDEPSALESRVQT
jgi:hypothetical protein